jgi:pimeloyl-ACP methyl ester carboxylesterase
MDRVRFDGVEVSYEVRGDGPQVVLLHSAAFASWFRPLVDRMPRFSTVRYAREPARAKGCFERLSVAEDAAVCVRLMDHLGWPTAHLVGHSYGALIALQLAMDAPARARSLVLLEPALRGVPSSAQVVASLSPVVDAYRRGDRDIAVDLFLQTVCGAGYRDTLERVVPGSFDTAVRHADLFFQVEIPVVQQWSFGHAEAALVVQPVLNVAGARTAPRFVEGAELLQDWFPKAERFTLPDAGHLLMVENPKALADALEGFFARHAIG